MDARAAVVVRWPPEQQVWREFIEEAVEEVMDPDKPSADGGSGWMGGAKEPSEIKQRRAVYERPSCNESVFGKTLAINVALRTLFAIK